MPRNNKWSLLEERRENCLLVRLEGREGWAGLAEEWRKVKGEMLESSRRGEDLPLPTRREA